MPDSDIRFLTFSIIGVYIIIVIGATTSVLGGDCSSWPLCEPKNIESVISLVHRFVTLSVAFCLILLFWKIRKASFKIRSATAIAIFLYPVQIMFGALLTIRNSIFISALHLTTAIFIFSFLILALVWRLEESESSIYKENTGIEYHSSAKSSYNSSGDVGIKDDISTVEKIKLYLSLTKPRLMWLLCLVALASMTLASGSSIDISVVGATLLGGVLSIGASGAFNNIFERETDSEMKRTSDRPIPKGQIPIKNAFIFAVFLSISSFLVFFLFVNVLTAFLGILAIFFYSVVYTLILKPNTTHNIVIGGAAGSFPALIGWAAVTGKVEIPAIILASIIFLWTPPHFYSLALAYKEDYKRASFPMLPVVKGEKIAKRHIVFYLSATLLTAVILGAFSPLDWIYASIISIFGAIFLKEASSLYLKNGRKAALHSFHASNAYLGALLIAIIVDSLF